MGKLYRFSHLQVEVRPCPGDAILGCWPGPHQTAATGWMIGLEVGNENPPVREEQRPTSGNFEKRPTYPIMAVALNFWINHKISQFGFDHRDDGIQRGRQGFWISINWICKINILYLRCVQRAKLRLCRFNLNITSVTNIWVTFFYYTF